jgi:hypothetical protein
MCSILETLWPFLDGMIECEFQISTKKRWRGFTKIRHFDYVSLVLFSDKAVAG